VVLIRIGIYAVIVIVLYFGLVAVLSELNEVVVLRISDGEDTHETRLWIVEGRSRLWLRAGSPSSGWVKRLYRNPHVEVEQDGETEAYTAAMIDDPEIQAWVNDRMARKYGFADWLIGFSSDRSQSIPIRLDPPQVSGASP
jgi:hypothetical protein